MIQLDTIYFEDCLIGMEKIADNSIDLILCDLPYGTTACSWDTILPWDKLWKNYLRVTKENSAIVLFGAEPFSTQLRMSNWKNYKYDWYWIKNTATAFTLAKKQPMRSVETISVFSKGTPSYYPQGLEKIKTPESQMRKYSEGTVYESKYLAGKEYVQEFTGYPNNVLRFDKESKNTFHPTQKPVKLLEYLVKTYSKKGEFVLDNCMGSGTTAIACINTDRHFIGFETNGDYYTRAIDRIKNNVTQLELF
ncbi:MULTISPECIES: site-specific DNA-methyltransferase [unclassified Enterococcus]|uniref:DNA-methyltransferase n=1 Tax=unclassified Enterococcus TaxID=2608891 RepID=UPI0013EADC69|nr:MULTISPECIES: site-specific DNA-methyltransferase [unclassified Enterococcus]